MAKQQNKSKPTLQEQLAAPFDPAELRWKPGSKSGDRSRAMIMPYVTGRAIMDRLDLVFGPAGWSDSYERIDGKAWRCRITATIDGRDVFKEGLSDEPQFEAIKGGASGALKRAAVKWGIGRYLYRLPAVWVDIKNGYARGNAVDIRDGREHLGHCVPPALPDWARPAGHSTPAPVTFRSGTGSFSSALSSVVEPRMSRSPRPMARSGRSPLPTSLWGGLIALAIGSESNESR